MASDTVSQVVFARLERIADSGLSPGSDRNMMLKPSDAQAILAAIRSKAP